MGIPRLVTGVAFLTALSGALVVVLQNTRCPGVFGIFSVEAVQTPRHCLQDQVGKKTPSSQWFIIVYHGYSPERAQEEPQTKKTIYH